MISLGGLGCGGDAVVAVRPEAFDASELCEAASRAAAAEHRDEIDSLGDQRARDRDDGFLNGPCPRP